MIEQNKGYKCKYCGEVFEKPVLLAHHVRSKHKRVKQKEKEKALAVKGSEQINRTIEAIGMLKALQASPTLSVEEKKIVGTVAQTIEGLVKYKAGLTATNSKARDR